MKKYSDFSDELSPSEVYEGLLGYGMFSEKLPPVFSSESFYNYCSTSSQSFQDKWRPHIFYDSMRNTNVSRQLGIPNPMAYYHLCKCISDYWGQIQLFFRQKTRGQGHIVSRVHLRKMAGTKMLFRMNYKNWKVDGTPEPDLLMGNGYIVHADISTCFPSIYTHSVPWALVGKDFAKQHAGKRWSNEWYNQIDHYAQNCKNGETHGVLIGPHASNLIGEIILTAVDSELTSKWKYIRNIDDYTCFVKTHEDAQLFLTDLSTELRKYDLVLNQKKTQIAMLPTAMTEQWVRQVGSPEQFFRNGIMSYTGVRAYLDSAIEIMEKNKANSAILNYAIQALPDDKLSKNAVEYCVKAILHLCLLYPYLIQIVDKYVFERFNVAQSQISDFSELMYQQSILSKNFDAICYVLAFAIKYGFLINTLKAQDAVDCDSCLFKLLAFLYFKKNGETSATTLLRKHALTLKSNEEDFGRNWLFVYEVLSKRDLSGDWKPLKANGISFLKNEYRV